jgi:hypothetical protein
MDLAAFPEEGMPMTSPGGAKKRKERPPTPDDAMSREEKEDFEEQVEEFEGPDPREARGRREKVAHEPGISRS